MAKMERRKVDDRFFKLYSQGLGSVQIWVDRETGVQYLWHQDGYGGGFTVLVDGEGRPLLYRESRQNREYGPEL